MKDYRDIINLLSLILDDNAQNFTVYADRLEKKLNAQLVQKLDFTDLRCWAYDLDGVMVELYWDMVVSDGVMIRMMDGEDEERLRGVAEAVKDEG